jgi:hypothetical protein
LGSTAQSGGHHGGAGGVLHHGVVDAVGRALRKGLRVGAGEVHVGLARGPGLTHCGQHVGAVLGQFFQIAAGREDEHAAVPQVAAFGQVALRGGGIGFFDELGYLVHRCLGAR